MGLLTKGLIGKEDLEVQVNTNVTETFERLSSTGDTLTLKKFPDIWNGTGKVNVSHLDAVDIDTTTLDATTITTTTIMQGSNYLLEGDATAGRVLRLSTLQITDGTAADTINCTLVNTWNGDAIAATDDIAKGATTGYFTLGASGAILTIEAAGLSGNCVAVLSAQIVWNTTEVPMLYLNPTVSANDISLQFRTPQDLMVCDLTHLSFIVLPTRIDVLIAYVTDA